MQACTCALFSPKNLQAVKGLNLILTFSIKRDNESPPTKGRDYIMCCVVLLSYNYMDLANIQGDGRKFLGHFKRHFMSQIPSESFEQGHIKRINPKFAPKIEFYHICVFHCFHVYVCAPFTFDLDLVSE